MDFFIEFIVDVKIVFFFGEGIVRVVVNNFLGVKNDITVINKGDGIYDVFYILVEEGMMIYFYCCMFFKIGLYSRY